MIKLKRFIKKFVKKSNLGLYSDLLKFKSGNKFEVDNHLLAKFIVNEIIPVIGYHPFPLSELNLMTATVCRLQPDYIIEWGTHIGKSARIFYETVKATGLKTEIHSIDLPEEIEHIEHPHQNRGKLVKDITAVTLHLGDCLEVIENNFNKSEIKDKKILFFVDGDHSYESVKKELNYIINNFPKAAILLHDTFYQTPESNYNVGPHQAIKEISEQYPNQYNVLETNTGLPGMTLLYK